MLAFLKFPVIGIVLLATTSLLNAADSATVDTSAFSSHIAHIYLNGNKITKSSAVMAYLEIDTGSVFDAVALKRAERRLRSTNLFLNVKILHLHKSYGYDLYVMLTEYPIYVSFPPQLDIYRYDYWHGQSETRYTPVAGMNFLNLGGKMESLDLFAQVGMWQSFSVSWLKPLLPSKYFLGLAAQYDVSPDQSPLAMDYSEETGSVTFGRRFFDRSKGYIGIQPDFLTVVDSAHSISRAAQAYGTIGWISDLRSSAFDPSSGALLQFEARSNHLLHDATVDPYAQVCADISVYHPFFIPGTKFAYRFYALLRNQDAGYLRRVVLGGVNTVRGYNNSEIGLDLVPNPNDAVAFTWEFRFQLYQFPQAGELMPEIFSHTLSRLSECAPQLDGALIFDYGKVAHTGYELFKVAHNTYSDTSALSQDGHGAGFGLRLMEPRLKLSLCSDFIWSPCLATGKICFSPRLYSGINF